MLSSCFKFPGRGLQGGRGGALQAVWGVGCYLPGPFVGCRALGWGSLQLLPAGPSARQRPGDRWRGWPERITMLKGSLPTQPPPALMGGCSCFAHQAWWGIPEHKNVSINWESIRLSLR